MSEEMIVENCSPTLAGIKTGNLFTCSCETQEELRRDVRAFNKTFVPKGLRMIPLRYENKRAMIYLYRPSRLREDFANGDTRELLAQFHYPAANPDQCVVRLIRRLRKFEEFPHEIGLFLGYPPEDVRGFIEQGANRCKCAGFWKVYGDEEKARKTFETYRRCMSDYMNQWEKGLSIDRLAVAMA
ncbi:MAG: DUF3793 family protein [Eubacteriales bacterium]|nr:DUF3793 family protein [Eubacteriales bacterium]